jgi:2-deoxy-D-gluconate 3-dehydrogenase
MSGATNHSNWLENQFSLIGKKALVTGASKGIGAQIAIDMAHAGADLILVGRNKESLQKTSTAISDIGRNVQSVICDFAETSTSQEAFAQLSKMEIDILVNNAGSISRAPAIATKSDDWRRIIEINLNAVFQLTQIVAEGMIARKSGAIINIASLLSFQGGINVPAYAASKHAIAGLTKSLANEWGALGVRVNAIAPGYIETDNTQALRDDPDRSASILSRIPVARWGTPNDISPVAVFLASHAARYINGEIITVDGGWMGR